jgi:hypothetical protein
MATKVCTECGKRKHLTKFSTYPRNDKRYFRSACNECQYLRCKRSRKSNPQPHRDEVKKYGAKNPQVGIKAWKKWRALHPEECRSQRLKTKYGITLAQYNAILAKQKGCCAVCGTKNPHPHPNFSVDHDHRTLKVRGLLCHKCNSAVGLLQDDPKLCKRAAAYLGRGNS